MYQIKLHRYGYQRRDDWQTLIDHGGGQLNNWGPHIIDHALRFLESPLAEQWSDLKKIAAVGDAEDHLHIILKGENGRLVTLEISGGVALSQPTYVVFGDRGALSCDDAEIQLKYLQRDFQPPQCGAIAGSPPIDGAFANAEKLPWVEETIKVKPEAACDTSSIWDHLFASVREGKPFPITIEHAVEVVRVSAAVKVGTEFEGMLSKQR